MTVNGELGDLLKVFVDGQEIDSTKYETRQGSTVITLTENFLNSLSVGTHTLEAEYQEGVEILAGKVGIEFDVVTMVKDSGQSSSTTATGTPRTGELALETIGFTTLALALAVVFIVIRRRLYSDN